MWCHVAYVDCCAASTVWQPFLASLSPGKAMYDPDIHGRKTRAANKAKKGTTVDFKRFTASISWHGCLIRNVGNPLTSAKLNTIDFWQHILIDPADGQLICISKRSARRPKKIQIGLRIEYFFLLRVLLSNVLLFLQFGRSRNALILKPAFESEYKPLT